MPSTHTMAKADSWVHHTQNILRCNRLTHLEPESVDDTEDVEVVKKRIE